jgi:hypothetical protein
MLITFALSLLEGEKAGREHDERQMSMQSLRVIEATFLRGVFVQLFANPTCVGPQKQTLQRGVFGTHAEPLCDLLFFFLLRRVLGGLWEASIVLGTGRSASSQPSGPV